MRPLRTHQYKSLLPEINQSNQSHEETVNRKAGQCGCVQKFQEPQNGCIGYHERGDKSYSQNAEVAKLQAASGFEQIIKASQEHQRHCHDEGEICCCFSGNPQQKAAGDGTTASGEAWPEGQALEETNLESLFGGNLVYVFYGEMFSHFFRKNHENTTQYEANDNSHRAKQGVFDKSVENQSQKARREHGNRQVKQRRSFGAKPVVGIQNETEFFMIHHQNRKNGPELDKYIK